MTPQATIHLACVLAALILFLLATVGVSAAPRFHFLPAGLALLVVAYLLA